MIQFFNPRATGDDQMVYNGEWPYIHWTEPFSIGMIRYKSLHFISETRQVRVHIDAKHNPLTGSLVDWNFALYNPGHIDAELYDIDSNYFCDLHAVATDDLTLIGHEVQMDGRTVYAYQLIILCRSDVEGEFIETFYINSVPYKIGAEFYGENESLRINLANQGTEIPTIIGKAIYGTDLYEENVDWVLLNRKFRELVVSHLDIMDNKGSYKSLFNALKWFEYDNLVELREVWKYATPDGTKYYESPVQTIVTDEVTDRMFNSAKTTYFALRHLKRRITGHTETAPEYTETTFDYDDDVRIGDAQTELPEVACKWSEEEMKLKMVLLGNFFETYFMPVHTDLIRSVVEDIVDYAFEIETGSAETNHEEGDAGIRTFDFGWGDNENEDPLSTHEIMLDEIHAYAGLPQPDPYWQAFENTNPASSLDSCPIIACHTYENTDTPEGDEVQVMAAMMGQVYNGIGAIEVAHFKAPEPIVAGRCISNQWGDTIETSFSVEADLAKPAFDVKFLFPGPGNYNFYFDLKGESGTHYTKRATITVVDNLRVQIGFYKVLSKPAREYKNINPFTASLPFTPMMSIDRDMKFDVINESDGKYQVQSTEVNPAYTQYIPVRSTNISEVPTDAPTTTKVRTIQWVGESAWGDCDNFKATDAYSVLLKNHWVESGSNESELPEGADKSERTAWVRICSKYRGVSPGWADANTQPDQESWMDSIAGSPRVFDLDAFFPELHMLVPIAPREHVKSYYPIVCIPEIHLVNGDIRRVNYSLLTETPGWEFYSYNCRKVIKGNDKPISIPIERFDKPISTPIMARSINAEMPRGMYRVTFNYRFGGTDRTVTVSPDWMLEK